MDRLLRRAVASLVIVCLGLMLAPHSAVTAARPCAGCSMPDDATDLRHASGAEYQWLLDTALRSEELIALQEAGHRLHGLTGLSSESPTVVILTGNFDGRKEVRSIVVLKAELRTRI